MTTDDNTSYNSDSIGKMMLYKEMKDNPYVWCRIFFKHHFRMKSPKFHKEMMTVASRERFLVIAAPRGSAKSTIIIFGYLFHGIIFKKYRFIVIISNTFKKAAMHLDTMKKEIRENGE